MKKHINLLEGPILSTLARLAFPIMGTSLIQMAYNLIDMIWIGRVSSNAVAAVGAAGMYLWLANAISSVPRMGGQVKLAQSLGAGNQKDAVSYAGSSIRMTVLLALVCMVICLGFYPGLIGFFRLNHHSVVQDAESYLIIVALGFLFNFLNQTFAGLLTAMGNSMVVFGSTLTGLTANIILDPVLIFGMGPFPKMGVKGAALATVVAQLIVFVMFLAVVLRERTVFRKIRIFGGGDRKKVKEIIRIGLPVAAQSMIFSGISMLIARMIADWGDAAVAVQKVGSQIESISWMTADGFASAVNAFIAQNYGAQNRERIKKGYQAAMKLMFVWGCITNAALLLFPEFLFRIFIHEADVILLGVDYLRILGISQLFMCLEITSSGAFQGLGRPLPSSVSGIVFNAARIPLALALSATALGLNGIWWSISISSIVKGLVVPAWFLVVLRNYLKTGEIKTNYFKRRAKEATA